MDFVSKEQKRKCLKAMEWTRGVTIETDKMIQKMMNGYGSKWMIADSGWVINHFINKHTRMVLNINNAIHSETLSECKSRSEICQDYHGVWIQKSKEK